MKAIVVMLVGACLMASARALTFADVRLTHIEQVLVTDTGSAVLRDEDLDLGVRVDTDTDGIGSIFLDVGVRPGERLVTVFDYTITLSNRGLPYPGPRTMYCTPLAFESQCVEPFGAEGTFAQILVGYRDPRAANPFIDMTQDQVTLNLSGSGSVGRLVQSGQLTSVVTTTAEDGAGDFLTALVFVNVFASPIPELSTYAAMLTGLALLAAVQARRRTRS